MKLTLKNLVGSPFDIQTLSGPAILPAFGELTGEFSEYDVQMFRNSMNLRVEDPDEEPKRRGRPPKEKEAG